MKDNARIKLVGEKVELVPYERKFVERYHVWMQDSFLLEMTASEPLSIEEEYTMQKTWREDSNKCTFIILSREKETGEGADSEIKRMVGDVNLFIQDFYYEIVDGAQIERSERNAEIDIMVAETSLRGQGVGRETVCLMLWYALKTLHINRFFAKISAENASSIGLFKKLGFKQTNFVEAFQEYEFQLSIEDASLKQIQLAMEETARIEEYDGEEPAFTS